LVDRGEAGGVPLWASERIGQMSVQNAPFISAVAAFIAGFLVIYLANGGWVESAVIGVLLAIVAYLVTSWQTRRSGR
jgi:hypothetical protein